MEIIEVAAGVVRRADGRVLICRRTGGWKGCGSFPAASWNPAKPPPNAWSVS